MVIEMNHSLSFSRVQHLKTRLNGAKVHCVDRFTSWQPRSDASIMFLDRQNLISWADSSKEEKEITTQPKFATILNAAG